MKLFRHILVYRFSISREGAQLIKSQTFSGLSFLVIGFKVFSELWKTFPFLNNFHDVSNPKISIRVRNNISNVREYLNRIFCSSFQNIPPWNSKLSVMNHNACRKSFQSLWTSTLLAYFSLRFTYYYEISNLHQALVCSHNRPKLYGSLGHKNRSFHSTGYRQPSINMRAHSFRCKSHN